MEPTKVTLPTLINGPLDPLSDVQIVNAALAFVNGASVVINRYKPDLVSIEERIFHAHKLREMTSEGAATSFVDLLPESIKTSEDVFAHLRERVTVVLQHALTNPVATATAISQDGFQLIRGLNFGSCSTQHVLIHSRQGYRVASYYEFANPVQLVEWGLVLILDEAKGFRELLRRCRWERCAHFFLAVKPKIGRPKRHFCDSKCMEGLHNDGGAMRMKRIRSDPKYARKRRIARSR